MDDNLKQIIDVAQSTDDLQRRQKQSDRFNCFVDDFCQEVLALIKKQFHEDNYDRLYKMVATYYNLFKKVVNQKSTLYKKEASRTWYKKSGKDGEEKVDDNYDEFMSTTNIHTASLAINKYANANNISFMRIKPDFDNSTIEYEPIPAENIIVLRDEYDPFKIIAILHKIVADTTFWLYVDEDIMCELSEDFGEIKNKRPNMFKDPNTNLGIIPYVPVWATLPIANDFWIPMINSDLYNVTLQLNVHLTHFNNVLKLGCYKQLAFTGVVTEDIKRLYNHVTDGLNPIALTGEQAKVDAILMSEQFDKFISALDAIATRVLDQHGFDFEAQSDSAQKSSGFAIKLRQDALNELKEEQQPLFRDYEKQLAYYTVVIANQLFKTSIDLAGSLRIDFYEEVSDVTPDDIAVYDWQMSNGIKSIVDIFKKFNPDVPDDQIEQVIEENKEINDKYTDTPDDEIEQSFNESQEKVEEKEAVVIKK